MDFDKILDEIGEFGRYQKTNYFLICLPVMFAAANSLSYVFTAGNINYRCFIPECDNLIDSNVYDVDWMENAVPGYKDSDGYFIPDSCSRFKIKDNKTNTQNHTTCPSDWFLINDVETCNQWIYDPNESTILNEWEITCKENAWKLALVGTCHFAGLVVGTAISGFLADRFGRKIIFILSIIFMSITGILQGLAWDYISFLIFAFLNAVGTASVYPLAFIIAVEMVGCRKREMSSIILNYFYAVGEALVGLLAWLSRDWRTLQYVLSAPPLLFTAYYWLIPESVRWLITKEKHKKALKIIRKAAKTNHKEISETLLKTFEIKDLESTIPNIKKEVEIIKNNSNGVIHSEDFLEIEIKGKKEFYTNQTNRDQNEFYSDDDLNSVDAGKQILNAFLDIIKSKILIVRFLILLLIWIVNAFVFYGLSLNSTNLSGNKYLNFALVCLVEIPGYSMAWIALQKFGRRWSLTGSLFLCAVTCIAGGFIAQGMLLIRQIIINIIRYVNI
ncbi:solute carrier family 22 member 4 [Condylostylus longicornis]|uniref:solute carrier family 22 member 4 n=1 Tax=Condylostylus longicornis TaxID=2530218 RepID=UPI00244E554D|nr:solute carrier family 22 member 4 [Condylostylus longicornis]